MKRIIISLILFLGLSSCTNMISSSQGEVWNSEEIIPIESELYSNHTNPFIWDDVSLDEGREKYYTLMHGNGGCQLPCIWGFTPGGELSFLDFFQPQRADIIEDAGLSLHIPGLVNWSSGTTDGNRIGSGFINRGELIDMNMVISIHYSEFNIIRNIYLMTSAYPAIGSNTDPYLNEEYQEIVSFFSLSNVLSIHGTPDYIFIEPKPESIDYPDRNSYPFILIVVYEEEGFSIQYTFRDEVRDEMIIGCPQNSTIRIVSWNPLESNGFESEIGSLDYAEYPTYIRSLEDATSLSNDEFTRIFRDPENLSCLETDRSLWPAN